MKTKEKKVNYISAKKFKLHSKEINKRNFQMLKTLSLFSMVVGFILSFAACYAKATNTMPEISNSTAVYFTMMMVATTYFIMCQIYPDIITPYATIHIYTIGTIFVILAIILGTILYANQNGIAFIGVITVMSFLILDYPVRLCIFEGISGIAYCMLCVIYKDGSTAFVDVISVMGFTTLAIVLCVKITSIEMENIEVRANAINQRDTDKLTGIANRGVVERIVLNWLESGKEQGAYLEFDVDNFKGINDTYGHLEGDRIIKEVAAIIRKAFRDSDCVARYGGDEFVAFLYPFKDKKWLAQRLDELIIEVGTIKAGPEDNIREVSISVGVTIADGSKSFDDLNREADTALYYAKNNGKRQYCFYESIKE